VLGKQTRLATRVPVAVHRAERLDALAAADFVLLARLVDGVGGVAVHCGGVNPPM
jgi:hypothetical protein